MELKPELRKRVKWFFVMGGLFLLSLAVVTGKVSHLESERSVDEPVQETPIDSTRIEREKKLAEEIESWRTKFEVLKAEIHTSRLLSTRRSYLRKVFRELRADHQLVRKELRDLRLAGDSDWEHLADHLEADLDRMEQIFVARSNLTVPLHSR